MTLPTVIGTGGTGIRATGATVALIYPAGLAAGDVMLLYASSNSATVAPFQGAPPAGWTLVASVASASPACISEIWKRIATGSETAGSQAAIACAPVGTIKVMTVLGYRNADPTSPFDLGLEIASVNTAADTATNTPTRPFPTVTTRLKDQLAISLFVGLNSAAAVGAGSAAGETGGQWVLDTRTGATDLRTTLDHAEMPTAGTISGGTAAWAGTDNAFQYIIYRATLQPLAVAVDAAMAELRDVAAGALAIVTTAVVGVTEGVSSLYDFDLGPVGGPMLRFCSLADFTRVIARGGIEYTPIPMEATGFEWRSGGALPQPTVVISNVFGAMNVLINEYGEPLGCPLTRIRILARWLDDGVQPDPLAEIGRDTFVIAQKTTHTPAVVAFKLAWRIDQEGTTLPRRLVLRDICTHIYRRWTGVGFDYAIATCPYTGTAMFTPGDAPTTDGSQDQCSRRLTGCRLRFPGAPLPSRAFPAVGRVR